MARQNGIIKLKGTIGDITFTKPKTGIWLVKKGGIDAKNCTDPAFKERVRMEPNSVEQRKAGKMLRTAFRTLFINSADSRMPINPVDGQSDPSGFSK
jgi:hypothetical protein